MVEKVDFEEWNWTFVDGKVDIGEKNWTFMVEKVDIEG